MNEQCLPDEVIVHILSFTMSSRPYNLRWMASLRLISHFYNEYYKEGYPAVCCEKPQCTKNKILKHAGTQLVQKIYYYDKHIIDNFAGALIASLEGVFEDLIVTRVNYTMIESWKQNTELINTCRANQPNLVILDDVIEVGDLAPTIVEFLLFLRSQKCHVLWCYVKYVIVMNFTRGVVGPHSLIPKNRRLQSIIDAFYDVFET